MFKYWAAFICVMLCEVTFAEPTTYTIDPTHTFVTWEVKHFGTSTSRGRYSLKSGTITVDWKTETGHADMVIDMASIDSGVAALDERLKGADFFATDTYPTAHFSATDLTFSEHLITEVRGQLTLRDQSQPVTLTATSFNCYFNLLFARRVCGGDFEATILRSDYGIRWGLPFVSDQVHLLIQIEAPAATPS